MSEQDHRSVHVMRAAGALVLALALALCTGCAAGLNGAGRAPSAVSVAQESAAPALPAELRHLQTRAFGETTLIDGITERVASLAEVGEYAGQPGVYLNDNNPVFSEEDLAQPYGTETYGELDRLGRTAEAFAVVGPETEPTQKRGSISAIHPSGWQQASYPNLGLDHLYERSHLIAHCLTAEDANERNLMTGTGYMNQGVMQTLEQRMDRYVDATDGHLLLRVTPIYQGDELVARGVQMQAYSLEDEGEAICFNVYLHNVQPGVQIDYATGASSQAPADLAGTGPTGTDVASATAAAASTAAASAASAQPEESAPVAQTHTYVANTNTKKFHYATCTSVARMSEKNKRTVETTRDALIAEGYIPCANCNP